MIGATIKVHGLDRLKQYMQTRPLQIARALSRAIKESGFILEAKSKEALTSGWTRAIDTGLLRSQNVVRELSDVRVALYPLVHYAEYVHEGTWKMRARPWLKVAAKSAAPEVRRAFDNAISEALK